MKLPIIKEVVNQHLNEFINYWSKLYHYPLEKKYNDQINNSNFKKDDIQELFIWKNGMNLSTSKQNSLDTKILSKLSIINKLKKDSIIDIDYFKKEFDNLSAVWKIFLLHITQPNIYPIYDQHIHRAHNYIHGLDYKNISADSLTNKEKEIFYFDTYLNFINGCKNTNLKKLDEAFFTFGKFINTEKYIRIVTDK